MNAKSDLQTNPPVLGTEAETPSDRMFQGIGVAPGISVGPVYLYARNAFADVEQGTGGNVEIEHAHTGYGWSE